MNKKYQFELSRLTLLLALPWLVQAGHASEPPSVLDPQQHPQSPPYQWAFEAPMVPIDSRLSWTQRFNGNEVFNGEQRLFDSNVGASEEPPAKEMKMAVMHRMEMDATGEIKSIRKDQGKVKIQHGPIDKYGMPGMTMMFTVANPEQLEGLEQGSSIGFNVDNSSGGFVVTHIMPLNEMKASAETSLTSKMDARGEVMALRVSQGKIKIKHGPIDKYGMPGMTMMFKVANPEQLEGLEKGSNIEFDIDNSSGGFVITNILPAKQ